MRVFTLDLPNGGEAIGLQRGSQLGARCSAKRIKKYGKLIT
jgi:hypothetical protein